MVKGKKNSILLVVIKYGIYLFLLITFWFFMGLDNPQIFKLNRTSVVTLATYVISSFASRYVFGGFDVGRRKVRDITNSLLLSQFMTDFITYMILMFMNTNQHSDNLFRFSAKKVMLFCVALQIIEIMISTTMANKVYFRLQAGRTCCVITTADKDIKNIRNAMKSKNLSVSSVTDYKEEETWKTDFKKNDYVIIYDIPLDYRKKVMEYAYKYDKNIYFSPEICDIIEVSSEHHMFEDSLMFYS